MNMNGEIPSIPIITLAGVSSLTNLLPELPLPTPHPHTVNKSLLYRPRLAAEAQQLLQSRNDALVNQLVNALRLTSSDHVEPCENLSSGIIDGEGPDLLKAILTTDPDIFKSGSVYRNSGYGFMSHTEMYSNQKSLVQDYQQMLPNGAVMQYTNQPPFVHSQASAPLAPAQGYASSFMMNGINSSSLPPPPPHQPSDAVASSSIGLSHQFSSAPVSRAMMFGVNMEQDFGSIALGTGGVKQENFPMASGGINQMPGKALIDCSPAQASSAPASASEPPLLGVLPSPHYDPYAHAVKPDTVGPHKMSQAHFPDPTAARVMLEPLNLEDLEKPFMSKRAMAKKPEAPALIPTIPLTRIDEIDHKKHKQRDGFAHYNVVQTTSDSHKLTLKLSKSKNEERKGTKRIRSDDEEFADMAKTEEEEYGEFATSLTERVKRRRQQVSYREDYSDEDAGGNYVQDQRGISTEASFPLQRRELSRHDDDSQSSSLYNEAMKKRKKERKQRKYMEMSGTVEELMETPTFKRFYLALDAILDAADDMNITGMRGDDEDDNGMGADVEFVISKNLVIDLCSEAAKLKSIGMMNQVPYEKLIKVLTILQYSIQDGCQIVPVSDPDGESEEEQLLRDLTLRRVLLAVDAALSVMYVMTSVDMPKEVFIEDVIERVVRLTKTQLHNAIYPEFDPVYRIDPNNKSGIQSNMKMKRAKASGTKDKATLTLYNKLTDLMGLIAELIDIQELTDTIILQASTLAVSPFFVENIRELQLNALKLVTNIFSRYELLRQLILDDILSSLARLPSSKKNLRSYRLNAVDQIQMVTALALQLIQCIVKFPQVEDHHPVMDQQMEDELPTKRKKSEKVDREVIILTSYETAMRTAHNFLAGFLAKCTTKGEEDYRSLFENFLYDLLATVNKPEWPASELILSLLGNLLVKQFSSKSVEMSLRVTSLDYLGIVAARLRKDAVSSRLNEDVILDIISQINDQDELVEMTKGKSVGENGCQQEISDVQKTEILQKSLLEYLVYGSESDPALLFARQFYVAQWYHDCTIEVDKAAKKLAEAKKGDQKRRRKRPDSEDEDDDGQERLTANAATTEMETMKVIQGRVETRKAFLLGQVLSKARNFATFRSSASKLKYENALLVTRYLASNRPFSHSFDIYLSQILKVLNETAVAVRTKALKCLTAVIEADPAILARMDMQNGVHGRFLDHSTSVREAAIELVGKFILIRPELTAQYYDMLSERILDTGISVRKRVIKIFRDICLEQTNFPKIPEMCVKMIRRVSDEEGIQKLVNETFQSMWFTPLGDRDTSRLMTRVMNIIDVVAACRDAGYDWLEQLMENLLKKEEESRERPVESACIQIVNCLVENVLQVEERAAAAAEGGKGNSSCLVACFSTLFLFCKVRPQLLVPHCIVIQPYLDIKCTGQGDVLLLNNVARILEMAVPLMDHPSESFLAQLEEDMMKLILKHGMMTIQSCVSCLASIVKDVTHNYKLVHDCFRRFFGFLSSFMSEKYSDPNSPAFQSHRPMLLRSLFTVGLLCRHFDLDSEEFGLKDKEVPSVREKVFRFLFHFLNHSDEEVRHKALTGIGFFVTRNYEFMLGKELRDIYQELLTNTEISEKMRCQVLANLKTYLVEEEVKMMKADAEWRKVHDKEDLKELGDIQSGMASTIIQIYLKQVLESFFHVQAQVRLSALEVIILILRQGLVHPIQCLPYLICMGSDIDNNVRLKADQQLLEIEKKYPGFVQTKVMGGIKMSYRLQELLQQQLSSATSGGGGGGSSGSCCLLRGVRLEENNFVSLNSYVYSLIRGNRGQRRALLSSALKMFDETAKTPLNELIFMADNIAYFPYQLQDEPLYIIHQIDIIVSVSGSNLIQSFRELFYPGTSDGMTGTSSQDNGHPDEDEEDVESLLRLMPDDVAPVQELFLASQGCILLLVLKQHLKDMYSFTDNKIQNYSLTDPKAFEKPVNRKNGVKFNPKQALALVRHGPLPTELDEDGRKALIQSYLDFKELMLSIDREENDDDFAPNGPLTQGALALTANTTDADPTEFTDGTTVSTSTACPVTGLIGQTSSSSSSSRGNRFKSTLQQKLSSEKRRGRPPGSTSRTTTKSLKPKHKKKKRRYNPSDSEADSDDGDSDPDWG